jgi:uncharacterized protein
LRGARQVGKTTLIEDFAQQYEYSILMNLEKPAHRSYFEDFDEAKTIAEVFFLANKIPPESAGQYHIIFRSENQNINLRLSM